MPLKDSGEADGLLADRPPPSTHATWFARQARRTLLISEAISATTAPDNAGYSTLSNRQTGMY